MLEEELKQKANEQVKTDIFKHTFVDAENIEVNEEDLYPMGD
jgi:FKBP-type peptidyl-prolyl cis-trans isomerase (trigger factor)